MFMLMTAGMYSIPNVKITSSNNMIMIGDKLLYLTSLTLFFQMIAVAYDPLSDMVFWSMSDPGGIYKKPLRSQGKAAFIIDTGRLSLSI